MFKSFGRKEGRNVTAQQAPPMPQISPDRYDTFSRDRQPSTGFSSSSLNGNGNAKSNGGNGFLSSVGSKKANAVNGNGNAPVERHGSALYPELAELMTRNERWAKRVATTDPGFFPRNYPGQRPEILWIGCSDARVPETTIMGSQPGDIFVHRGIANLYTPSDDSLNAVLMIALINFQVKHIIVCGHSNCVGCQTALRSAALPPVAETQAIQRYLRPLTSLARALKTEDGLPSLDLLIEENVIQQVKNLVESPIVQDDWKRRGKKGVTIHGWVYQLENGTVRCLNFSKGPPGSVPGARMGAKLFTPGELHSDRETR